jgi:hypothetical protein
VTPEEALADLTELSRDVEVAVIVDGDAQVLASTLADGERAHRLGRAGLALLENADGVRRRADLPVGQLYAALRTGGVFVVRDAGRAIVATTGPETTAGLVLYDLGACLRALAEDSAPAA